MTKIEEIRSKLKTLDENSNAINLLEDAIYKLNTGVKLEFWLEKQPDISYGSINIQGRLSKQGFKAVKDAICADYREQIVAMTAQNKLIRQELGEHEESL